MSRKPDTSYLPLWLSANELARLLGVSRRTIRRYHADGRIPAPSHFTRRTLRWHRDSIFGLLTTGPQDPGFFAAAPKKRRLKESD